jgi:hypothetical protein
MAANMKVSLMVRLVREIPEPDGESVMDET